MLCPNPYGRSREVQQRPYQCLGDPTRDGTEERAYQVAKLLSEEECPNSFKITPSEWAVLWKISGWRVFSHLRLCEAKVQQCFMQKLEGEHQREQDFEQQAYTHPSAASNSRGSQNSNSSTAPSSDNSEGFTDAQLPLREKFSKHLTDIQSYGCRMILRAMIRCHDPKKKSKCPYTEGNDKAPAWWPVRKVAHKDLNRLKYEEVVYLIVYILDIVIDPKSTDKNQFGRSITVKDLKRQIEACYPAWFQDNNKTDSLKKLFKVAEEEEQHRKQHPSDTIGIDTITSSNSSDPLTSEDGGGKDEDEEDEVEEDEKNDEEEEVPDMGAAGLISSAQSILSPKTTASPYTTSIGIDIQMDSEVDGWSNIHQLPQTAEVPTDRRYAPSDIYNQALYNQGPQTTSYNPGPIPLNNTRHLALQYRIGYASFNPFVYEGSCAGPNNIQPIAPGPYASLDYTYTINETPLLPYNTGINGRYQQVRFVPTNWTFSSSYKTDNIDKLKQID